MPQTWNLMPDVLGQYNAGVDRGRSLQASKLAGLAYGADNPDDQQSYLASLASLNPGAAMQLGDNLQQRANDKLAQIGAAANYLVNAHQTGNQAAVQGAYQAIKPTLQKFINEHGDSSTVPDQWDDSMLPNLYQVVAASQHAVNGRLPAALQTFNAMTQGLNPDQVNEARRIKAGLDPRATSPNYSTLNVPDGQGGTIQMFYNKRTGQVEQPNYGSAAQSSPPSAGPSQPVLQTSITPASPPVPGIADIANSYLEKGLTPDAAVQAATKQTGGNGQINLRLDPTTNRFVDATPQLQDAPSPSDGSGAPQTGYGLGRNPPKQDKPPAGYQWADAGHTRMAPIPGGPADKGSQQLSDGDLTLAKQVAAYKLNPQSIPAKSRDAILEAAAGINPDFDPSKYTDVNSFNRNMSMSSPGSFGGTVAAAKTAIDHLTQLADVSSKLPGHYSWINGVQNAIGKSTASSSNPGGLSGSADYLKQWGTTVNNVAGEFSKMIKGGVPSEPEVAAQLKSLDPNDPNRDQAIAALAQNMWSKIAAVEDARAQALGPAYEGKSILTAAQQAKLAHLISLGRGMSAPQFGDSTDSNQQQGTAAPATGITQQPQTSGADFSHLWGGN